MIQQFLRNCWNQNISSDEFYKRVQEQFHDQVYEIAQVLITYLVNLQEQPPILIDYLHILYMHHTSRLIPLINSDDNKHIQIFSNMFENYGDAIFIELEIGEIESTRCVLEFFNKLAAFPSENCVAILKKMALSYSFSVLVASMRLFFPKEFKKMKTALKEKVIRKVSRDYLRNSISLFVLALINDNLILTRFKKFHSSFVTLYLSAIHLWSYKITNDKLISIGVSKHLLFHVMREFVNHPSMLYGTYIIQKFQDFATHYYPSFKEPYYKMPYQQKLAFFTEMHKNCILCPIDETEEMDMYCNYFPCGMTVEDAMQLFGTVPETFNKEEFFETALKYPAYSMELIDFFISNLTIGKITTACSLCSQANKHIVDFLKVIVDSDHYSDILKKLVTLLYAIDHDNQFEPIWITFLSLIKFGWAPGGQGTRKMITDFINVQNEKLKQFLELFLLPPVLKPEVKMPARSSSSIMLRVQSENSSSDSDFLKNMIQIASQPPPQQKAFTPMNNQQIIMMNQMMNSIQTTIKFQKIKNAGFNDIPPIEKCIKLYGYISEDNMDTVVVLLEQFPYLWLTAISWGINTKSKRIKALFKLKYPEHEILKFMVKEMMAIIYYKNGIRGKIHLPDMDYLMATAPVVKIAEVRLSAELKKLYIQYPKLYDAELITSLVVEERAWIAVYGIRTYINSLLKALAVEIKTISNMIKAWEVAKIVSSLLIVINDNNNEQIYEILHYMEDIVDKTDIDIDFSILAEICFALIMAVDKNENVNSQETTEFYQHFYSSLETKNQKHMDFFYSLIKTSIYWPFLHRYIQDDAVKILIIYQDYRSAVEFYISRAFYKSSEEIRISQLA